MAQGFAADDKAGYAARALSLDIVDAVVNDGQTLDALQPLIAKADLPREDRAFAMTLALHALRYHGALKKIAASRMDTPLPPAARRADTILILGLAQILLLKTPPHAAVGLSVDLAKGRMFTKPYANLINAVLRRCAEADLPAINPDDVLPEWLMRRWRNTYGETTASSVAAAQLEEPPLDVSCAADPGLWAERLGGIALPFGTVRLTKHKGAITDMDGFNEGAWWVQDAAARLPVLAFGDVKGKRVLDMCAAPGGKTAALIAAGAHVTALDRSKPRLGLLQQNLARLNMAADVICADAETWEPQEAFDAVLLDAPCSSTGTLRRHPDVAFAKKESDIFKLSALQQRLLHRAALMVKPGGILVYSTCSLEPEEGEAHVAPFLKSHPHFAGSPLQPDLFGGFAEPLTGEGLLRARPDMLHGQDGMDGFFAARFIRTH